MITPEAVLGYWFEEKQPSDWFLGGEAVDAEIRTRFEPALVAAHAGSLEHWRSTAAGSLAYLLLTDQFSRNMYRGTARAYASDPLARAAAESAIELGFDMQFQSPKRQFFYLPFEHSESLTDQERAVRLVAMRLPQEADFLLHARAHREIIRQFGRFPFRNLHLGRRDTPAERAFMEAGAYAGFVKRLRAAA